MACASVVLPALSQCGAFEANLLVFAGYHLALSRWST
jgi:hypothetical protein